jgi:hypothetical protein
LFLRTLTPVRLHAGTRLHITCRLFDAKGEVKHRNDYLFASNEDAVPFDSSMLKLIRSISKSQVLK